MSKQLNIHLFNCDRTYKLKVVEDWLNEGRKTTKSELGIDLNVESRDFSLSEMTQLSDKTIPGLGMDVAVFVVHAHESRLSINEENAGIGYAKLYRALLKKTGNRVMIVIGGDDNYKNKDEEDREFISRWAKRKISSQFTEEFLDGRKSFVFSWDKKHRKIHEEALLHFFDQSKKGEKFQYNPPQRKAATESLTPPSRARNSSVPFRRYESLPESLPSTNDSQNPPNGEGGESYKTGSVSRQGSQGARPQEVVEQRTSSRPLPPPPKGLSSHQGARPKKATPFSTDTQEHQDLVVLGCKVSEGSIYSVMDAIESIRPILNLHEQPPAANLSPAEARLYLERHSLKYCVLVVDGETIQDSYENLPARKDEYEDLLKTAVKRVANKFIILVCDSLTMPVKDEKKVLEEINRNVGKKGFIAWLKEGRLTVHPDVLAQFLDPSLDKSYMMSRSGASGVVRGQSNVSPHPLDQQGHGVQPTERIREHGCEDWNVQQQQTYFHCEIPASAKQDSVTGKLVLKSKIRYGNISFQERDIKFLSREFQGVPDEMQRDFMKQYRYTDEVEVKIMFVPETKMLWVFYGDYGVEMANNDLLLLKTRVINGQISFCGSDVELCYPNWTVPGYITESLKKKACNGTLFIISDEKGNLRTVVQRGTKEKLIGLKDKAVTAICAPLSYKKSQK